MRIKVLIVVSLALVVAGLAIAREQSGVTTLRLEPDQIVKIMTAPGLVTRISFPHEVQEIICGDLYDPNLGTGSFVIQRSGHDVFLKPVAAKGTSNIFVKAGEEGEITYGFDLEIVPAAKAQRVVNVIDARPVALKKRLTRPRRVQPLTPPAVKPVISNSILGDLPNWIATVMNLSDPALPDSPELKSQPVQPIRRVAIRRVAADYPEIARKVGAQGEVVVELVINEAGKVTSAKAVSGHMLLRNAAIQAARLWKFTPVPPDGGQEQSVARITFNFQSSYTLSGSYFYSIGGGAPTAPRRQ